MQTRQAHVIDRKIDSLSLANSLIGDPSDHIFLGVFERDRIRRKTDAAMHFYMAAANGHPEGYRLYKDLNIPAQDYVELYQQFVKLHQINGDQGLVRLGQYYLGKDAFRIAKRMTTKLRFSEPNDYIWPRQKQAEELAYRSFHMASICGLTSAYEWRAETARFYQLTPERENALRQQANGELEALANQYGGGEQDAYCERLYLNDLIELLKKEYVERATVTYEESLDEWDGRTNPCDAGIGDFTDEQCDEFDDAIRAGLVGVSSNVPSLAELLRRFEPNEWFDDSGDIWGRDRDRDYDDRGGRSSRRPSSSSQVYRNNPGGMSDQNIRTPSDDGLPAPTDDIDECVSYTASGVCEARASALSCNDRSKYHFNRGEADMAMGRIRNARQKFDRSLTVGRPCQSEYAVLAGKRLAALNLTCEYTIGSLARISRGYASNPEGGAIIDLQSRQRALSAKGYYEDEIDGEYGPATRQAIRDFQREFGFSETGDLTPIETVYLMCSAAQVHADRKSMNTLGIMYIAGLGVVQNTDAGLRLLKAAAERGNTDAKFNLALIYGTGTVLSSYQLCGLVENLPIADAYLREAANEGHRPAQRLIELFGALGPTARWQRVKEELELNSFYRDRLEMVGEGCRPNPGP